jgi:outer membrane protein assembly factor BamB
MRMTHVIGQSVQFRSKRPHLRNAAMSFMICLCGLLSMNAPPAQAADVNVTTYHNDTGRSGWNPRETILTPTTVAGGSFKKLASVPLDGQVDAEPLYVARQKIAGGVHDTVYVATENDTIYAIDASTGKILIRKSLGFPVPESAIPGGCPNNVDGVGINSTPVIDMTSQTLYVMAYNYGGENARYWLHALDLGTLADKIPRVSVAASATLSNGQAFALNPANLRQRAGLLLKNDTIYAAFTSFCDNIPSLTRGWVLGWKTGTLDPIDKILTNNLAASPKDYFLSTIWMSGFGLAADGNGSVFFVTGNTDPQNTKYYPNNLAESVVKLRSDLRQVQSYFTPGTAANGRAALDKVDNDFGAGGVMVMPPQPGMIPRLAVAAGKVGIMYLMNRDSLGGYTNGADNVLQTVNIGECYCGPSYFEGSDKIGRIVSSGGQQVKVWKVVTSSNAAPNLVLESTSAAITSGQDAGFFTSISSNTESADSQIIWALSRPSQQNPKAIELYAFDPSTVSKGMSKTLFSGPAGNWPNGDGNANLVPMVTNGHVYVASYKELAIFGLAAAGTKTEAPAPASTAAEASQPAFPGHAVYGRLKSVDKTMLTLETRTGTLTVDSAPAQKAETSALPVVGRAYLARGEYDDKGVLHAVAVSRVKDAPELWKADR